MSVDLDELAALLVDGSPMAAALGMKAVSLSVSEARAAIAYGEHLIGHRDSGVVHGGVVSTLLDHTCGMMAFAVLGGEGAPATLDLRIDYYRPATPGQELIAVARPQKVTGMIAYIDGLVHHGDEEDPVARAHCAMMLPRGAREQADRARAEMGLDDEATSPGARR